MKRVAILAVLGASVLAAPAHATLVTFDDLPGLSGVVQNGYGGINWNSNFSYFSTEQRPFTANSGSTRIFANYALHPERTYGTLSFTFNDPVQFQGFYASGYNWNPVSFGLYVGGVRVAFSDNEVMPTFNPQYVFTTYQGFVDEVRIYNVNGFAAFDDFMYSGAAPLLKAQAFNSTAVPEPASWAMMIAGFGLVGGFMRRRSTRVAFS
jgi:hypothetical protein